MSVSIEEAFAVLYKQKLPMEIIDHVSDDSGLCRKFQGNSSKVLSFLNFLRDHQEAGFCDVVLEVEGQSFPAHRCVLAANSQFFYTLFTSGMRDSNERHINLRSLNISSVTILLNFFYGNNIVINKDNAEDLLEAASFLLLDQVKNACAEIISSNLSISNCFSIKSLAERYTLDGLKVNAYSFMAENFQAAKKEKEFLELEPYELKELISSDSVRVEKEEEVFEAMMNWVKHDPTNRAKELSTLLPCLRYGSLSREYVEEQFRQDPIFENIPFCQTFLVQGCQTSAISEQQLMSEERPSTKIHDVIIGVGKGELNSSFCFEVHTEQLYQLPKPHSKVYQFGAAAIGQDLYTISCNKQNCSHLKSCSNETCLMKHKVGSSNTVVDHLWDEIKARPLDPFTCSKKANVISFKGKLYIVGGCTSYKGRSVDIQCYDPDKGEWKAMANMNTSRCRIGAVATSNYIYALGGDRWHHERYDSGAEENVERYDPDTNKWTTMPKMFYARYTPQVVATSDSIFVIGQSSNGKKCHCEVFKESTNKWSAIPDLPRKYPMLSLSLNDEVYAIAGGKTWKYSKEGNLWKKSSTLMFKALQHWRFYKFYYVQLKLPKFCYEPYRKISYHKVNDYEKRRYFDEDWSESSSDEIASSDGDDNSTSSSEEFDDNDNYYEIDDLFNGW